jgi:Heparinase II/III-like protein
MTRILFLAGAAGLLPCMALCAAGESNKPPVSDWGTLLDAVRADPGLEPACAELIANAHKVATTPIVRRAKTLAEVGTHRTWLDGRSKALEDETRETFALAMSDFAACNTLAAELPVLAAAYRVTGEAVYRDRIVEQIEEMVRWSPLQRPGWSCYAPGLRLPADGKDGNWLATGCGIRAISNTLDLLPDGALDDALLANLHTLLKAEVAGVVDDWATKRSWFIRDENPITNQWVLPTEALVEACLILGVDTHRDAYELGVKNLLMALDAHGPKGEFEEGVGYASFTVTSMLQAAHAMAVAGDRRAIDRPFLAHFPTWLVHHLQPGDMRINCFDAGGAQNAAASMKPLLSLIGVCTNSSVARWALNHQTDGPSTDLPGLAARGLAPVGEDAAPGLFTHYERATRVNWRDSWDPKGTGVWVRGGHPTDQHDHQDRGHVNFIHRGRPILIEAGTPSYHHKLMMTHYTTGVGHNLLQLGTAFPEGLGQPATHFSLPGWQKRGGVAPITVNRLDEEGGDVLVDGTACYDGLARWHRKVTWDADQLTVNDEATLEAEAKETILFRWHLGTEEDVAIDGGPAEYTVTWADAVMTIEGSVPLSLTQGKLPDHTLAGHTSDEDPGNEHTCLVVQTAAPGNSAVIRVKVEPN